MLPLAFQTEVLTDGVYATWMQEMSVAEIADALSGLSQEHLCVLGVNQTYSPLDWVRQPLPLAAIATRVGLEPTVVDSDTILIRGVSLSPLLREVDHYDMLLFDVPVGLAHALLIEKAVLVLEWRDEHAPGHSALARLPHSTLFLQSNDDCYLYVESRRPAASRELLARLLRRYALRYARREVSAPSADVLEDFLTRGGTLTLLGGDVRVIGDELRVECSRTHLTAPWRVPGGRGNVGRPSQWQGNFRPIGREARGRLR